MKLTINEFNDGDPIPGEHAFCIPDIAQNVALGNNKNPGLQWNDIPELTRSLVLICVDRDVPTLPDDVNQEDREVPADLERCDFYHWLMIDIPPEINSIAAGSCSNSVTPHGKQEPNGPSGTRQGINDYTQWFNGDESMQGEYFGYDGPCPPWNDSIIHHYDFILFATDLERCPVEGSFTGQDLMAALNGHVLAESKVTGTYTLNPRLIST